MSVKEREEVFDLDFTYGDEYVHLFPARDMKRARARCGAPGNDAHKNHFGRVQPSEKVPTHCSCGAPICPACAHCHEFQH